MKRMFRKQKNDRRGFTLVEMLTVVLIMVLVTSVIAAGVPAAVRAYRGVVDSANARAALSTAVIRLRDELGTATAVQISDEGEISYIDSYGRRGYLTPGAPGDLSGISDGLRVTYRQAFLSRGVVTIGGLRVSKDGVVLAELPELCVRVIVGG